MNIKFYSLTLIVLAITCCSNREKQVDKNRLLAYDYRLFQGTPIWELAKATQDENTATMKKLIKKEKNLINYKEPKFGQTLLSIAVRTEKYQSVSVLLQCKANPNCRDNGTGETPLMLAAKAGGFGFGCDSRYLKILLKYGADPNLAEDKIQGENISQKTPLLIACSTSKLEHVKVLLKAGANINFRSEYGENALHSAIISRNADLVLYLLNNGVDYKQPMSGGYGNKNIYVLDALKTWHVESGSTNENKKLAIIKFLNDNGVKK